MCVDSEQISLFILATNLLDFFFEEEENRKDHYYNLNTCYFTLYARLKTCSAQLCSTILNEKTLTVVLYFMVTN